MSARISVNPELEPNRNDSECPQHWRKAGITPRDILNRCTDWLKDQSALLEAFWVAVTFHVLLFPLIWFVGWALPWPKTPQPTIVIELNLENWPNVATPEKITEIYNSKMSEARGGR